MITLIGLGPGDPDLLSRGAEKALREASAAMAGGTGSLLLRTARHPCVDTLRGWGLGFETFDGLYESASDFASLYREISRQVVETSSASIVPGFAVYYAVPGHPLMGEESVRLILEQADELGIEVKIVSSGSFIDATLTAAGVSASDGLDIRDALTLSLSDSVDQDGYSQSCRFDTSRGLLLFQVYSSEVASHAKLALLRDYPDDWEIHLIDQAGASGQETVRRVPLHRLDREPVGHLTSIFIPPLPPQIRPAQFNSLVGVMSRLRAPNGCPWDLEQTHESLKRYFVEETYEVLEAIDLNDADLLCEELGDVLLQVVFHAQLAAEEGVFHIDDVISSIVSKLLRRHPHVFGTTQVANSAEVLRNWEQIKRTEKTKIDPQWRKSALDGVPIGLPALMRAMEISKRAVKVGFDWPSFTEVTAKLDEEWAELKAELAEAVADKSKIEAELGDLLFTVVQIARWLKIDPEEALRSMLIRFTARFQYIEARASEQGSLIENLTLAEMDTLWEEAKKQGREKSL